MTILEQQANELAKSFGQALRNKDVEMAEKIWNNFIPTFGTGCDMYELSVEKLKMIKPKDFYSFYMLNLK